MLPHRADLNISAIDHVMGHRSQSAPAQVQLANEEIALGGSKGPCLVPDPTFADALALPCDLSRKRAAGLLRDASKFAVLVLGCTETQFCK